MTNWLPDEMWSYLFRPPPAWPWSIEPGWRQGEPATSLVDRDVPGATRAALAFLEELGFVLTAPDAWDLADDAFTIAWERADAVLFATLALDGSFFILVGPRPADDEDSTPTRARLLAMLGDSDRVASFGSFPVLGATPDEVAAQVAGYVSSFRERLERLLADRPIDPERLAAECTAAVEAIVRPRQIEHTRGRAEAAWADGRWASYLDAANELEWLGAPLDSPRDLERIETATANRPPPLDLGDEPLDPSDRIRRAVQLVDNAGRRLNSAVEERDRDADGRARWDEMAREWHEAMGLLYSPDFQESLERLRLGEADAIEPAIVFLEVDPWAFRTGYAKETILRYLKRATLDADQARRVRAVVLHAVDVGDRREFRGYCKLARRVVDDAFRSDLLTRMRSTDPGIARRALWMVDAIGEPLGADDRATARGIVERAADDPQWWRSSSWIGSAARRHGDRSWIGHLLARALAPGPDRNTALRLLTSVAIEPTDAQREALGSLVLEAVRRDEDNDWIEGIVAQADHPALRVALISAYLAASDEDARRLTWWAINSIRRTAKDGWPGDLLDS
jgi:hypothetical protein